MNTPASSTSLSAARLQCAAVALVNDTDGMRRILTEALERHGVSVLPYSSGEQLLKDPRLHTFRLVVADWTNSPSGANLWECLLQKNYPGRVVFMSPHAQDITEAFTHATRPPADIIEIPTTMTNAAQRIVSQLGR